MSESRDETQAGPPSPAAHGSDWEEVSRGPVTVRMEPVERPLPPELADDGEPKPQANMRIKTELIERPAPRGDAAEARKEGQRPNIEKRFALMERRAGGRGAPPSIGSMDPSRRA